MLNRITIIRWLNNPLPIHAAFLHINNYYYATYFSFLSVSTIAYLSVLV